MKYNALLFCPDEKTARVVTQVLTELEFRVEPCNEPFAAVKKLMAEHFDAIVVDCDSEQNAALLFKSAHNSGSNQSSLAVAVVEGQTGVAKAFRIGANLVLTKPINVEQSKGTLRVARGLLRKTEAGKPASAAASPGQSAAPVKPPSGSQMPAPFLPAQPAPSPIPAVSASIFDVEADPTPKPEPAEAALLESMPAPVPLSAPGKDYPWQPIAKPAAEPMATALRRAAEVTGRSADAPAKNIAAPAVIPPVPFAPSFTTGMASGQGAATAPAKIAPKAYEKGEEPETAQVDAPAFASLGAEPKEEASGGGNKTLMIAAVAVIAVATIGYIGWTKMQSGPTPVEQNVTAPAHVAQAPVQPPVSEDVAQPASSARSTGSTKSSQPASTRGVEQGPDVTLSTKAERPSPSKKSDSTVEPNAASKTAPATKSAPIVVKNEASNPVPPSPFQADSAQPPAAGTLTAVSNTNDAAISGIMNTVKASTPQQAPQKLKVSQGVSQGLLIKSVDPVYPALARQMRIQGAVELMANIGADGSITSVKLLSGDSILAQAAITAVKQWKYKPYYLGDQPVAIQTQITMKFKLP
jgi:TonB family protein